MHFLECPKCGSPLEEEKDRDEFTYCCTSCSRRYLYEEGTLVDLGRKKDGAGSSRPSGPDPEE